jgi:Domain of unknown function (DUF4349)
MSGRKAFVGSIVLAMGLGLFTAACSSARTTASAPNATRLGKGAAGVAAGPRSAPDQQRGQAFAGTVDVPVLQPKVVKNADLSLRVKTGTFADVFQQATLVAGRHGGYVASSQTNGSRLHSGSVVIRVPAEQFDAALADLRGLGRVESERVSGNDVTAQFVDLQARLKNWQAQEAVLLKLMDRSTSISDSVQVEQQLQDVQLNIEEITGQLRVLGDQADYSTITAVMAEVAPVATPPKQQSRFARAWRTAAHAFVAAMSGLVVAVVFILPFGLLALLVALIVLAIRRLRARVPAAPTAPPAV